MYWTHSHSLTGFERNWNVSSRPIALHIQTHQDIRQKKLEMLSTKPLDRYGFSYRESQLAIMVVGNTMFGRKWKLPTEQIKSDDDVEVEESTDMDS